MHSIQNTPQIDERSPWRRRFLVVCLEAGVVLLCLLISPLQSQAGESTRLHPKAVAGVLYPPPALRDKKKRKRRKKRRRKRKRFSAAAALSRCTQGDKAKRIACLFRLRYKRDWRARRLVMKIYKRSGWVIGAEQAQWMEGGWRGRLWLASRLPVGRHRRHLRWLRRTVKEYDRFFSALQKRARKPLRYRWKHLAVKFFHTRQRTPSAYALDWEIGYNVSGALMRRYYNIRNTLFHEIFHLNDHAQQWWSKRALQTLYKRIIRRCTVRNKLRNRCLTPYTPTRTMIRRLGIYYAFHSESGVEEYAAELAERYFREHRSILYWKRHLRPFKCKTPENAAAWKLLAHQFFGGVDLTRKCR